MMPDLIGLEAGGSARPDELVIRIYWDDAKEPAVGPLWVIFLVPDLVNGMSFLDLCRQI